VFLSAQSSPKQLLWLDRTGAVTGGLALPPEDWARPVLSPDGRFVVCRNGNELWRVDIARSVALRLASGESNSSPVWSPDGKRIAFALSHEGTQEIQEIPSDGSAEAQVVPTSSDLFKWPEDWARAGLIFMSISRETQRDLWLLPSEGGSPEPLLHSKFSEWGARVSPDGHWMAYICNEAGSDDVYLQSFPEMGHKVRVSTTGASRLWWMPSSSELCYRSGDEMVSVPLTKRGEEMEPGAPRALFRYPQEVEESEFSPDGRRILISAPVPGAQKRTLGVILDWTALAGR
jgi:Tol biopolymer transport system component